MHFEDKVGLLIIMTSQAVIEPRQVLGLFTIRNRNSIKINIVNVPNKIMAMR